MKIVIAPDAFKDSLSAEAVASAMENGVKKFSENAICYKLFASDGGEGFLDSVATYIPNLKKNMTNTVDPLGRSHVAYYLFDSEKLTAYIELAKASGIELLKPKERNPLVTSTYGTGLQIKDALEKGAEKIYLGIGGSATNDAGTGIAQALGYEFLDEEENQLNANGENLVKIKTMRMPEVVFNEVEFFAVNDVLNPLFGPQGAAHTYAKQKGASPSEIEFLDKGLQHIDQQIQKHLGLSNANIPGAGAAGGTAFGCKCFLNANFISGTSFILGISGFKELLTSEKISCIVTGEGKIDFQTAYGKFVYGMIQEANQYKVPVLAVCGKLDLDTNGVKELGLLAAKQLYDPSKPVSYSFENAEQLVMEKTLELLQENFIQ